MSFRFGATRPKNNLAPLPTRTAKPDTFAVSPRWFYAVQEPDGKTHLALSSASAVTIWASAPAGVAVFPASPVEIHVAAARVLDRIREMSRSEHDRLTAALPGIAIELAISEIRRRHAFSDRRTSDLGIAGLWIVRPEGMEACLKRLPSYLLAHPELATYFNEGPGLKPPLPDGHQGLQSRRKTLLSAR